MTITHALYLIAITFICSMGFGIVFRIRPSALIYAGIGGALTRAVFIAAQSMTDNRLAYTFIAAAVAAFYAEGIAHWKKAPLTKYLYPAFVPIIPGDLLYNTVVSTITVNEAAIKTNGLALMMSLLGIVLGSMFAPMITQSYAYWRGVYLLKTRGYD